MSTSSFMGSSLSTGGQRWARMNPSSPRLPQVWHCSRIGQSISLCPRLLCKHLPHHVSMSAMDLRWLTSLMGQPTGRISHNSWAADVGQHQRFFHISWASRCRLRLEKLLRNYPEDPEIPDKCKGVHMY